MPNFDQNDDDVQNDDDDHNEADEIESSESSSSEPPTEVLDSEIHHLQVDIEYLTKDLKRADAAFTEKQRTEIRKRIAVKEEMIAEKQLEIVKIKAIIRRQKEASANTDAYLHQDPGNYTNEEDIHPSRLILTNPTIYEYFEYFHQYDFQPGSDSLVAADSLLKATNALLPHINGLAYQDIDVTKAYSQNLEHIIHLAHPWRVIDAMKKFDVKNVHQQRVVRTCLFGNPTFSNPVLDTGASNAQLGDHTLVHLHNDFVTVLGMAKTALKLEREATAAQLKEFPKAAPQKMSTTVDKARLAIATLRNTPQAQFDPEAFTDIIRQNNSIAGSSTTGITQANAEAITESLSATSELKQSSSVAVRNILTRTVLGNFAPTGRSATTTSSARRDARLLIENGAI